MRHILALVIILSLGVQAQAKNANHGKQPVAKKASAKRGKATVRYVKALNTHTFAKLTHSKRMQYFKAYNDYLSSTEGERVSSFDIIEFLLPTADAKDYLRNAGFIVPAGNSKDENFDTAPYLQGFPSSCTAEQTYPKYVSCYPGMGVTEDNRAFCVANDGKQFASCKAAAEKKVNGMNGSERLVEYINQNYNSSDPDQAARMNSLKMAIGGNVNMIDRQCASGSSYCNTLKKSLDNIDKELAKNGNTSVKNMISDAAVVVPAPSTALNNGDDSSTPIAKSCSMAIQDSVKRMTGKNMDNRWSSATMLARQVCPGLGGTAENAFIRYGVCFSGNSPAPTPQLQEVLDGAKSNLNMSGQQQTMFTNYFGMSTTEFKGVFCGSKNSAEFGKNLSNLKKDRMLSDTAKTATGLLATSLEDIRNSDHGIDAPDRNKVQEGFRELIKKMNAGQLKYRDATTNQRVLEEVNAIYNYLNKDGNDSVESLSKINIEEMKWIAGNIDSDAGVIWGNAAERAKKRANDNGDKPVINGAVTAEAKAALNQMKDCLKGMSAIDDPNSDSRFKDAPQFQSNFGKDCKLQNLGAGDSKATVLYSDARESGAPVIVVDRQHDRCYTFEEFDKAENRVRFKDQATGEYKSMTVDEMTSSHLEVRNFACRVNPAGPANDNQNNQNNNSQNRDVAI